MGCWVTRAGNEVEDVEGVGSEEVEGVGSEEVEGVGSEEVEGEGSEEVEGEGMEGVGSEEVEGVGSGGSDAVGILLALAAKPLGVLLGTRPCHCLTRFFILFASFRLVAASFRRTVLTCFPSRVA